MGYTKELKISIFNMLLSSQDGGPGGNRPYFSKFYLIIEFIAGWTPPLYGFERHFCQHRCYITMVLK